MLDPLTALSLASNVVQFVDFGIKLFRTGRELHDSANGYSVGNQELEIIATNLQLLNLRLRQRPTAVDAVLSETDRSLVRLAEQCEDIAGELLEALNQLKVKGTSNRRFESFKQALKTYWKKDQLDSTNARLQNFRDQLNLHILVSLKESLDLHSVKQSKGFQHLDRSTQALADSLLQSQENTREQLTTGTNLVIRKQATTNALITDEHERTRTEIIATIERNRKYDQRQPSATGVGHAELDEEKRRRREDRIEWEDMEKRRLEDERLEAIRLEKERKAKARLIPILILDSLRFPTMSDRFEEIDTAHRNTFEWIFREPDPGIQQKVWDSFPTWLEKSSGIYFMNGKAASGKSTLMRYVHDEPRTMKLLEKWSRRSPLVVGSHFFWNSGTQDQRSYVGLLRSLLFKILEQIPELIPEVFAHQFNERNKLPLGTLREGAPISWTLPKLSKAFRLLFTLEAATKTKFCLFIDGLDEYDGDYPEIIDLFLEVSAWKNVKVCLSSRPLRDFVVAFKPYAKLRLQDLTFDNIKQYVDDELGAHPQMKALQKHEPDEAPKLVLEVVNKADGVFLWVKIVVVSLLRGLRNSDRISDLEDRLRRLPPSLEDLFSHIIGRLEPVYLAQASRIFQIFSKVQKQDPWFMGSFTSIELYFAEVVDRRSAMQAQTRTLTDEDLVFICDLVESWLQTRCGGLIEAHEDRRTFGRLNARLSYLHRTVRDFLELPDIWSRILTWTARTEFDASLSLFQSQILYIKCLFYPVHPARTSAVWGTHDPRYYAHRALRYAYEAELKTEKPEVMMLEELDRVCSNLLAEFVPTPYSWAADGIYNDDMEFAPFEQNHDTFLAVAIIPGLYEYVSTKVKSNPSVISEKQGRPLLQYAVAPIESTGISYPPLVPSPKIISLLLMYGAQPNDRYKKRSAWEHVLAHLLKLLTGAKMDKTQLADWLAIVKLFVRYGADATECLNGDPNKSAHQLVTANFYEAFPKETKEIQQMLVSSRRLIASGMPVKVSQEGLADMLGSHKARPVSAEKTCSPQPSFVASTKSSLSSGYIERRPHSTDNSVPLRLISSPPSKQPKKWSQRLFKRFRGSKSSSNEFLSPQSAQFKNYSEGNSPADTRNHAVLSNFRNNTESGPVGYFDIPPGPTNSNYSSQTLIVDPRYTDSSAKQAPSNLNLPYRNDIPRASSASPRAPIPVVIHTPARRASIASAVSSLSDTSLG